jgi:hypothetical protein
MKAGHRYKVPKRDLMSTRQVLLQTGWLKIAQAPLEAAVLVQELLMFQVKITAAVHDIHGAWREGSHNDLILAVALTCWSGEQEGCHPLAPRSIR